MEEVNLSKGNKKIDESKVDLFVMTNGKYFESHQLPMIKERLLALDDSKWLFVQTLSFKDPIISLVISFFAGSFGIDRFFVGDAGLGVAKLLTCGGLGFWTMIDWFLIMDVTRKKNMETLRQIL